MILCILLVFIQSIFSRLFFENEWYNSYSLFSIKERSSNITILRPFLNSSCAFDETQLNLYQKKKIYLVVELNTNCNKILNAIRLVGKDSQPNVAGLIVQANRNTRVSLGRSIEYVSAESATKPVIILEDKRFYNKLEPNEYRTAYYEFEPNTWGVLYDGDVYKTVHISIIALFSLLLAAQVLSIAYLIVFNSKQISIIKSVLLITGLMHVSSVFSFRFSGYNSFINQTLVLISIMCSCIVNYKLLISWCDIMHDFEEMKFYNWFKKLAIVELTIVFLSCILYNITLLLMRSDRYLEWLCPASSAIAFTVIIFLSLITIWYILYAHQTVIYFKSFYTKTKRGYPLKITILIAAIRIMFIFMLASYYLASIHNITPTLFLCWTIVGNITPFIYGIVILWMFFEL